MKSNALIYCENEFGKVDGKVANGLVRQSDTYNIIGIIDSTKSGLDAGEYLEGIKNGIPIFESIETALKKLNSVPNSFIYGIAPITSFLNEIHRKIILTAIKSGMNIVNGLPEFFNEDEQFTNAALTYGVTIRDIRKPPKRENLHNFSGRIRDIKTPTVTVMGTDCAVGKRTSALLLVNALKKEGLNVVFITTGQTGLLQGSNYGIAVDVLASGYASGEVENAILQACKTEDPDIIIVEGQGALGHPGFTSSSAIIRGAMPDAIIIQHPPKRKNYCDYPNIPMTTLEEEIKMVEIFSKSKVIAITINHENMSTTEVNDIINTYESKYNLPTTDVLQHGCDKLVKALLMTFPKLKRESALL
ncbi:DUF1611 domain-containing protein [uncultured Kordia sp.]|uniref:DUF1611 domain-containing protein n=1 Tax=uncultured Kordia sp. TaxID=507699 RepID=UPI00260C74D3|nr:DUF1611 domain-containing protein [uncultured Kordia sp.]